MKFREKHPILRGNNCPKMKVAQCPTLCDPMDDTVHGILQAGIQEWAAMPFYRGSSSPRDRTQVSCIVGGFFTSWATGKPKDTGVVSLSLLQRIFPIYESNWGLLHRRQLLYQLSYQESPVDRNPPASAGDMGSIPGLGKIPHSTEQLGLCYATTLACML